MASPEQIDAEVRATEFALDTKLTPRLIEAHCLEVAKACRRIGYHKVVEGLPLDDGDQRSNVCHLLVKSGTEYVVHMTVAWEPSGDGSYHVSLTVNDYSIHQQVVLGFIPVMPKLAHGLPALRRFSELLQQALQSGPLTAWTGEGGVEP